MLEPFYVNPRSLVLFNPKRKHKRKKNPRVHRRKKIAVPKKGTAKIAVKRHIKRRTNPMAKHHRRRSRRYRTNPAFLAGLKKSFPSTKEIVSGGLGVLGVGYAMPRLFSMFPVLAKNAITRIVTRLGVIYILNLASKKIHILGPASKAAFWGQLPYLTNDALSFANMRLTFGQGDDDTQALEMYYGESPLMLGESPEMGMGESPEMGMYYGEESPAIVG